MWANSYEIEKIFMGKLSYEGDLLEEINSFCANNNIRTGQISVIGAVKTIKLGYFDQNIKKYIFLDHDGLYSEKPFEISSCSGNVSIKDENPFAHIHIVVSDREGRCFGGHVMPGTKIFAGEFIIHSFKGTELIRSLDEKTQLPLWKKS